MIESNMYRAAATEEGGAESGQVYHFAEVATKGRQFEGHWNQPAAAWKAVFWPWHADWRQISAEIQISNGSS